MERNRRVEDYQTNRQDLKHLKLLVSINRCFFTDLLEYIPPNGRPDKAMDWLQQHSRNILEAVAKKHLSNLEWDDYFPLNEIKSHPNQALQNFVTHQLRPLSIEDFPDGDFA